MGVGRCNGTQLIYALIIYFYLENKLAVQSEAVVWAPKPACINGHGLAINGIFPFGSVVFSQDLMLSVAKR